ncbi:MAG: UbiA family prenyltransferase [Prolixibacteraceae bacterium]
MVRIPVISWYDNSTLRHLRFPFSFFLLPVFLFALSQAGRVDLQAAIFSGLILHLLIFPSSNGYNSYQDRDETSIGGLKHPPKVSENLFYATLLFDLAGLIFAWLISPEFAALVFIFIVMSRLYSYRGIRLKKYPVAGFLTVFIFQGAFVYLMALVSFGSFSSEIFSGNHLLGMTVSSLFIGSIYPLTQIYQHEADKKDGVISISYKLGYTGTFLFSGLLFTAGTLVLFILLDKKNQHTAQLLFLALIIPVVIYLTRWFSLVRKNKANADFGHTMRLNLISAFCMNLFFSILIINHHLSLF